MYHIKLVDRLSDNKTRSRVCPALRYSIVDSDKPFIELTFWTDKNVCSKVHVCSEKESAHSEDENKVFEAYVMNDNGKTIEVIS